MAFTVNIDNLSSILFKSLIVLKEILRHSFNYTVTLTFAMKPCKRFCGALNLYLIDIGPYMKDINI